MTLTSVCAQTFAGFRVLISDQSDGRSLDSYEVRAAVRVLEASGKKVEQFLHLSQGMAEQRQFLLDKVTAPYVLFLDDDLILEPDMVERMLRVITIHRCGFAGSAPIGLSFLDDIRPDEQNIEFWETRVAPETIRPGGRRWERHRLHNAANVYHLQKKLGLTPKTQKAYKVAWVGACVLYDTEKLRRAGGFKFWRQLPPVHAGEDVLAQNRVMKLFGGCGIIPSGVYHLELPTTISNRTVNAIDFQTS